MNSQKQYFHLLNALRGIAAILVVGRHTYIFGPVKFPVSGMAVDIFFLLSGVVIEANYQNRLANGMMPLSFIWLRIARIYPLYILGSMITLLTMCFTPHHELILGGSIFHIDYVALRWALALFVLPSPFSGEGIFVFNHPAWSLFYELLINAFYGLIAIHLTSKRLPWLILFFGIGLIANLIYFHSGHLFEFGFEGLTTSFGGLCRTGFSFFLGMALCRVNRVYNLDFIRRNSVMASWMIITLTATSLMAPISAGQHVYFYVFSVFCMFPAIIFAALAVQPGRIFAKVCDFLGNISYPIYALHVPLFCVFSSIIVLRFSWTWLDRWRMMGLVYFILLLAFSYTIDKTYDRWAKDVLRNLRRPPRIQT
jgi:peptidoglycan/LPS O-acetylase OafA/YrhL